MRILVISAMFLFCLSGTIQAQIFGLGDLPGGGFHSQARGVSSDGSVVSGFSASSNGSTEAFRWTQNGGMVGLGILPHFDGDSLSLSLSEARGLSADGSVAVGLSLSRSTNGAEAAEAFRWTQNGGMVGLGDMTGGTLPATEVLSVGFDVSADGSVVGYGRNANSNQEAFRWTEDGGMVGLGDLPGGSFRSEAYGITADGSVVVGRSNGANGREAFRWTENGGMVGLGGLFAGDFESRAWDVSPDGSVVVGTARVDSNSLEAFRWTENEGMVALGDLPGGLIISNASAVSDDGSIVIGRGHTGNSNALREEEAFYWTQELGMVRLYDLLLDQGEDLSHWTSLDWASEMTGDGRTIIGRGTNIDGNTEAFVATFSSVPEPSSGILLIGTLVGFALRRQRRQSI